MHPYTNLPDVTLSPEDAAQFDAAVAQADRDHPPTHFPATYMGVTRVYPIERYPKAGMLFRGDSGRSGTVRSVSKTHVTLVWDPYLKETLINEWPIGEWLERCRVIG